MIAASVKVDLASLKVPASIDDFFLKSTRGTKRHVTTKPNKAVLKDKKEKAKSKKV